MSDQTMFEEESKQNTGDPGESRTDPFVDKLSSIRNENGEPKYKDVGTALDALAASQQFIEQLKREKHEQEQKLQEAMGELHKMGSIEDFVKRISPNAASPSSTETPKEKVESFSEDKLSQMLEAKLRQARQVETEEKNFAAVVGRLTEIHGDKASEVIRLKAQELGTTPAELKSLSRKNPAMALSLLGGAVKTSSPSPSTSTTVPPRGMPDNNPRPQIERGKGIARGGRSNKELQDLFKQSREYTNKRLNIES